MCDHNGFFNSLKLIMVTNDNIWQHMITCGLALASFRKLIILTYGNIWAHIATYGCTCLL